MHERGDEEGGVEVGNDGRASDYTTQQVLVVQSAA